jgi:hypothetical protein
MKTLLIAGALALVGTFVVPATASAELYQYVSCTGNVKSVNAVDWNAALITAPDIARHSGVVRVSGTGLQISSTMMVSGAGC